MYRKLQIVISLITVGLLTVSAIAEQAGLMPVPIFTDAKVESLVAYDPSTGFYTYSYTITNPATNTGKIGSIDVDISQPPNTLILSGAGLTIPYGFITKTFDEDIADFEADLGKVVPMVPVGIRVAPGWAGSLGPGGFASFSSGDPFTVGADVVIPGETQGGFDLISRGLPTIRQIELIPEWVFLVESEEDVTSEMQKRADEIEESLPFKTKTLGPTAPSIYFNPQVFLETIRGYINESVTLVWLKDPALAGSLKNHLDTARLHLDANDPSQAKTALRQFMTAIDQAASSQRTTEAQGLLFFNAQYLVNKLPDTPLPPPPPVPHLELAPKQGALPIGVFHTLSSTFTIETGHSIESPIVPIKLMVTSGPNTGLIMEAVSSAADPAIFSYTSRVVGTDQLEARVEEAPEIPDRSPAIPAATSMQVKVTWTGGPDLTIDFFIPPLIKAHGGQFVPIREITGNHGNYLSGESITRYFLSLDEIINPVQDTIIGERFVPPLGPGEVNEESGLEFQLPDDLPQGTYHLGACADADQSVIELNEANNCLVNQVVIALEPSTNQPPNCNQAIGSPNKLWPPNHKLVAISIVGITDPGGDPIAVTITGITQDEPVNGLGDGDTSPDGSGVGSSQAQIRAERSGTGNGRVYAILFTAGDGKGGSCSGSVNVGVPHDQGKGAVPIDDGQNYNSTQL